MKHIAYRFAYRMLAIYNDVIRSMSRSRRSQIRTLPMLLPMLSLLSFMGAEIQPVKNGGFEAVTPAESWRIDSDEAKQQFSVSLDASGAKEGSQSLLVSADHPVHLTLRQEVFLPIGTLWRLTGWVKSSAGPAPAKNDGDFIDPVAGPRIGIEAQVGDQGYQPRPPQVRENGSSRLFFFAFPLLEESAWR